ncbi:hypothetical protein HNQ93_003459 [Hymenobacter luteus]|uniref:Uncharacterized protein n=2 Tax=Hymenobacter TaxID=89966 RepID=A0A7W9T466_9BACT|nr:MULTISPECIES: hypothetical protein [Hymenobacter]MBB4602694.1 hypothetical protein [Hymenobacter latericoloratus]MBB6060585.1 hypothetical protein [Hymenobacter luteus]
MKRIFATLPLILSINYQSDCKVAANDIQDILNRIINTKEITKFTEHYVSRNDTIYFCFEPSPAYNKQTLQELRHTILKIKNVNYLVYTDKQNESRKPVITFQILELTKTTASVRLGFSIEGVVGNFSLEKKNTWNIRSSEVYEI